MGQLIVTLGYEADGNRMHVSCIWAQGLISATYLPGTDCSPRRLDVMILACQSEEFRRKPRGYSRVRDLFRRRQEK